jgi:hypothetical protein
MEKDEWDQLQALPDWQLHDFVTERESSQRRHAAQHILSMRRNKAMERVTMWSAIAAGLAAIASIAQLFK